VNLRKDHCRILHSRTTREPVNNQLGDGGIAPCAHKPRLLWVAPPGPQHAGHQRNPARNVPRNLNKRSAVSSPPFAGCVVIKRNLFYQYHNQGRVINTWADIINRANLCMEVMHERNAHNFPLDLASVEAPSVNG
jgi:hypothetical protein